MSEQIQKGSFLFYYYTTHWNHPVADLIELGEWLQHPNDKKFYYHIAIAVSETQKIEANGLENVGIYNIDPNETFDVVYIDVPEAQIDGAIENIKSFVGQEYDWLADLNDAIRALTHNKHSLPEDLIEDEESRRKVCSTLGLLFAIDAGMIAPESEDKIMITTPQDLIDLLTRKLVSDGIKKLGEAGTKIGQMMKSVRDSLDTNNE